MSRSALRVLASSSFVAALLAIPAVAHGATYEVCPAGPPACDFSSLSDAVADPATLDGDRIELAAGVYAEPQGVDVDKGLEIVGAGSGATIIDGNGGAAAGQGAQLEVRTGSGQDVSISGLTVREPVSNGAGLRIGVFAKSTDLPGPAHHFSDVAIEGVGGPGAGEEYGLWADHSSADLTFEEGSISGVRFNPVLIEQPVGSTTISGNEIARGTECCGLFFMTSIAGENSDGAQRVIGNTLTGGAGITFNSAFVPSAGRLADIEVSGNSLSGIAGGAITLNNSGSGDGSDSVIADPVVHDNTVSGTGGARGVTLQGYVDGASIRGNTLAGLGTGVRVTDAAGSLTHEPAGTVLRANRIAGNGVGVQNTTAGAVDAEQNWWGCNEGPAGDDCNAATGPVDADPWLTLSLDGPAAMDAGTSAGFDASLIATSDGGNAASPGAFPVTELAFAASDGAIDTPKDLVASAASTDFTAPNWNGPVTISAELDGESAKHTVDVSGAPLVQTKLVARPMLIDDHPQELTVLNPIGRFNADLTDQATGEPIEGKEIVFSTRGSELCRGTTDADGRATCTVDMGRKLQAVLNVTYTASFAGDPNHEAATNNAGKLVRILGIELL